MTKNYKTNEVGEINKNKSSRSAKLRIATRGKNKFVFPEDLFQKFRKYLDLEAINVETQNFYFNSYFLIFVIWYFNNQKSNKRNYRRKIFNISKEIILKERDLNESQLDFSFNITSNN